MAKWSGGRAFLALCAGQFASLMGSGLFGFAIGLWVFEQTGSAWLSWLVVICDILPGALTAPLAGRLVDRSNRRTMLLAGLAGGTASTLLIVGVVALSGFTALLYVAVVVGSLASTLCHVAAESSVILLAPALHLGRSNGLLQLVSSLASVGAPILASYLLLSWELTTLFALPVVSFAVAAALLWPIAVPDVPYDDEPISSWQVISSRRLTSLLVLFTFLVFAVSLSTWAVGPMVLDFATSRDLATVLLAAAVAMVAGAVLMTVWGGPRRPIVLLLVGMGVAALMLILEGLRPSFATVVTGAAGFAFVLPIVNAANATIWQTAVPVGRQGRVFGLRRLYGQLGLLLAIVVSGPLIEDTFRGALAKEDATLGSVFGIGPGRGIGILFALLGVALLALAMTVLPGISGKQRSEADESHPDGHAQDEPGRRGSELPAEPATAEQGAPEHDEPADQQQQPAGPAN